LLGLNSRYLTNAFELGLVLFRWLCSDWSPNPVLTHDVFDPGVASQFKLSNH